jgi:hypothetical protein
MLAVFCGAALFVGLGVTTYAKESQHKKKKQEYQVQQLRHPDITQHEQRWTAYRQYLGQRQPLHQQSLAQLLQEKRNAQYRYQQRYAAQMLQEQRRYRNMRNFNYQKDHYFRTPYDRRYNRGGIFYETNRYGEAQLQQAIQYGYAEGFRAGVADRQDRWRSDYERSIAYQDANYGYNGYYVALDDYNYYFREGFRRGYEDGFTGRYQYGRRISGRYSILGNVLAGILTFEMLR